MTIAFFDLDRTLLSVNSGGIWARSEWQAGRLGWLDLARAGWLLGKYTLGIESGLEAAYRDAVRTLAGQREDLFRERTRQWFLREVAHLVRPGGVATLDEHRHRGDRLVLATSSNQYIAEIAIEVLGLDDWVATVMEVDAGRFTGAIASMAYGPHKAERIVEYVDSTCSLADCYLYTDSVTDLRAMESVGFPIAVHPDRKLSAIAHERGWPVRSDWS